MIVATINDEIVGFSQLVFSNKFSSDLDVDCEIGGLYIKNGFKIKEYNSIYTKDLRLWQSIKRLSQSKSNPLIGRSLLNNEIYRGK